MAVTPSGKLHEHWCACAHDLAQMHADEHARWVAEAAEQSDTGRYDLSFIRPKPIENPPNKR